MINVNGNVGYTIQETCAIIALYIHRFKGVKVNVTPDFNSMREKELFEKAATIALPWYELNTV